MQLYNILFVAPPCEGDIDLSSFTFDIKPYELFKDKL